MSTTFLKKIFLNHPYFLIKDIESELKRRYSLTLKKIKWFKFVLSRNMKITMYSNQTVKFIESSYAILTSMILQNSTETLVDPEASTVYRQ